MKKGLKLTALLLALLMMLASLAACGDKGNGGETSPVTETEAQPEETKPVDYKTFMPEQESFEWETINFLIKDGDRFYMFDDEESTLPDQVKEQVAKMNNTIETTYEVELDFVWTWSDPREFWPVMNEVMTGAREMDIIVPDFYYGAETCGVLVNMLDYSNVLHFENPYWLDGWNDQATINGKLYNPASYIGLGNVRLAEAIFFNQYYAEDLLIADDLFQLVRDGQWTKEKMLEMMEIATKDSGDGEWSYDDANDKYGLIYNLWSGRALLNGFGFAMATNNEEGISFDIVGENNVNRFQDLYRILKQNNYSYYSPHPWTNTAKDGRRIFTGNRALFMADVVSYSATVSDSLDSFGIIPLPKYDSTQPNYVTPLMGCVSQGVLTTSANIDASMKVLEAMAIISYVDMLPVYYEDMLKLQYQSDPRSAEMIDLVMASIKIDFAFIFTKQFDLIADSAFDLIAANDRNYVNSMKGHVDTLDQQLIDLLAHYGVS